MNERQRNSILEQSWIAHEIVENSYLVNTAVKGDSEWLEKQRILLADMALHLLQTALNSGDLEKDKLRNNLYSIMTIADQFLPEAELESAKQQLFS